MKIVFFVVNYEPHQLVSIEAILKNYEAEIHAVSYQDNIAIPRGIKNLYTYQLKDFTSKELLQLIINIHPRLLCVPGWSIKEFVRVAKDVRKILQIPVVSFSDTQWQGNIRQRINCVISPWHVRKAFSHMWVAGVYQYEYARKLGFSKNHIVFNSLQCDLLLFTLVPLQHKAERYPKKFLFIGRFVPVKGLDLLIKAWHQIQFKDGWTLTLIGDGPLKEKFKNIEGVIIKDFMPQSELSREMEQAGCFVLTSIFEPWGLVIQEAAASGLPIIATDICGAAPHLVINNYNGYQVRPNVQNIKKALQDIINMDKKELFRFAQNSRTLASNISPSLGVAHLMSVVESV